MRAGDYNQVLYLPHRTATMQWYANYLDAMKVGIAPAQIRKFEKQVNGHQRTALRRARRQRVGQQHQSGRVRLC